MRNRISKRPWVGLVLVGLFAIGCARETPPEYTAGEKAQSLPPKHQAQLQERLVRLFGSPLFPRPLDAPVPVASFEEELPAANVESRERIELGAAVYRVRCAGCHGVTGDGQGEAAAYMQPKPRDYRQGVFKFTSTPYGMKPVRADLVRTIRRGAKGTAMPAFRWMSEEELQAVIDYVILLSQRGEVELYVATIAEIEYDPSDDISDGVFLEGLTTVRDRWNAAESSVVYPLTPPPAYDDASIVEGRRAFLTRGCSKCHGDDGKGQTKWLSHEYIAQQESLPPAQRDQINLDVWNHPAPAADLTARMLHGGRRPIDIYRRIFTGINGTPMPSFSEALSAEPETIWQLVDYVQSIVEGRKVDFSSLAGLQSPDGAAGPPAGQP